MRGSPRQRLRQTALIASVLGSKVKLNEIYHLISPFSSLGRFIHKLMCQQPSLPRLVANSLTSGSILLLTLVNQILTSHPLSLPIIDNKNVFIMVHSVTSHTKPKWPLILHDNITIPQWYN